MVNKDEYNKHMLINTSKILFEECSYAYAQDGHCVSVCASIREMKPDKGPQI